MFQSLEYFQMVKNLVPAQDSQVLHFNFGGFGHWCEPSIFPEKLVVDKTMWSKLWHKKFSVWFYSYVIFIQE